MPWRAAAAVAFPSPSRVASVLADFAVWVQGWDLDVNTETAADSFYCIRFCVSRSEFFILLLEIPMKIETIFQEDQKKHFCQLN